MHTVRDSGIATAVPVETVKSVAQEQALARVLPHAMNCNGACRALAARFKCAAVCAASRSPRGS